MLLFGWDGTECSPIPAGSTFINTGIDTPDLGYYCPPGALYNTGLNSCIACPAGTDFTGTGGMAIIGCYCPAGSGWNGTTCVVCPTGTNITNTGGAALIGCYCLDGLGWNGTSCG